MGQRIGNGVIYGAVHGLRIVKSYFRLRGVDVDSTVTFLLDRGLIEEVTASGPGPATFRTTTLFLERLGLARRGDLPTLERFELTGPEAQALRARLQQADLIAEAETGDG